MRSRLVFLAPFVLATALSAGCAARVPHIADLKLNPGRYEARTVSVQGVVTNAWGVPLVPVKFYRVSDGTGDVMVISQHGYAPTRGARVRVRGKVSQLAVFGGQSYGLHVNEEKLDVLR